MQISRPICNFIFTLQVIAACAGLSTSKGSLVTSPLVLPSYKVPLSITGTSHVTCITLHTSGYSSVCWTENKQGQPGYQPTCASVSCRSGYTNQREKKCGAKTGGRRLLGEPLSAPAAANDNDDVDATPSPVAATGCISNREAGSIGGTCQQWSECRGKTRQSSAQGAMGCGHLSSLYKCCFDPNGRKAGTTGGTGGVTTGSNGDGACNHDTCCKQNKLCSAVACPAGYTTRKNVDRCSVDYKCQVAFAAPV
jgi:hypothetical protein